MPLPLIRTESNIHMIDRVEIRLDAVRRRQLDELAENRHVSISELVRTLLDREYQEWLGAQRLKAAQAISALSTEDVPEPDLLEHQLGQVYESPIC